MASSQRIRPCYVDDETVIRMVGKGLGLSMMAEMMIRGQLDGVRVLPIASRGGPRAWDGAASARGAVRGDRPAAQLRAGIHRGRGEGARKEIEMEKRR